jgi:ATP-grasp domain, R2K clade family 2
MPTLILTPRFTDDAQALWRAAIQLGWSVERLTSWRVPEELRAVALDVGIIRGRGWAVVELNSAWGAGIYGCDPARVLEVLQAAAVPSEPAIH